MLSVSKVVNVVSFEKCISKALKKLGKVHCNDLFENEAGPKITF